MILQCSVCQCYFEDEIDPAEMGEPPVCCDVCMWELSHTDGEQQPTLHTCKRRPLSYEIFQEIKQFVTTKQEAAERSTTGKGDIYLHKLSKFLDFLKELEELYIECDYCGRKISPSESRYTGDEEVACNECHEEV